jgi:GTPase SAR1 family protein
LEDYFEQIPDEQEVGAKSNDGAVRDLHDHLLGRNLMGINPELTGLLEKSELHFTAYQNHDIPVLLVGPTKVGKSTTINQIVRRNLVKDDQWKLMCQSISYQDSGESYGLPVDHENEFVDYNVRNLPCLAALRFAEVR